ncbi:phospholipase A1-Ibeta2, chloroplastic [Cinnamomum micranthum f. kanehirae]|uniref:Phospholipase A1-Ibeta2, chloroplastic n=1 Tax=Cinnamomum micranthum f. kanehirae TaxID=337451 RepID=A0A3S3MPI7_9MAGN|nr:phospholipase A1-Ibeta2, chloroplastic [Cinnamomum micranthum f. kanehirae]
MQIGSMISAPTIPSFRIGRSPSTCRGSPLNPLWKTRGSVETHMNTTSSIATTITHLSSDPSQSIQIHLSHLDRLLQKVPSPLPDPYPPQDHSDKPLLENRVRGFIDGLNLSGIWPRWQAAEDMSPRHLKSLQRLLSKSPEYSPRNKLGERWQEYHGCNDWAGLLDPLDENLRREVVRYGEFVQAAYNSFHSNPATSADAPPTPRHVALPDRSYKVTKSLYATSSIGLPGWVDDVAPDLEWMTQRSSWVGYVAVCDNDREIRRMGRRDIVIALRGTATCLEWGENFRASLVPIEDGSTSTSKVECGFWSLYKTGGAHVPSLSAAVAEEVKRLMELYKGEALSITVTGHSLGAALALLAADEISTCAPDVPPVAVFSFGGPRVGNRGFGKRIEENGVHVLRVVNAQDVITRVPGVPVGDSYSHVGSELRVDSRSSPYLKPNADVACCHDLEAYLHLVDGFLASDCPFRENAKRSLVKLLDEQGSNVKKLYMNKALKLNDIRVGTNREVLGNINDSMVTCLPSPS